MLQCCQARQLSVGSHKQAASSDQQDIPKSSDNTTRNILVGLGAAALGAGAYYVCFVALSTWILV